MRQTGSEADKRVNRWTSALNGIYFINSIEYSIETTYLGHVAVSVVHVPTGLPAPGRPYLCGLRGQGRLQPQHFHGDLLGAPRQLVLALLASTVTDLVATRDHDGGAHRGHQGEEHAQDGDHVLGSEHARCSHRWRRKNTEQLVSQWLSSKEIYENKESSLCICVSFMFVYVCEVCVDTSARIRAWSKVRTRNGPRVRPGWQKEGKLSNKSGRWNKVPLLNGQVNEKANGTA